MNYWKTGKVFVKTRLARCPLCLVLPESPQRAEICQSWPVLAHKNRLLLIQESYEMVIKHSHQI